MPKPESADDAERAILGQSEAEVIAQLGQPSLTRTLSCQAPSDCKVNAAIHRLIWGSGTVRAYNDENSAAADFVDHKLTQYQFTFDVSSGVETLPTLAQKLGYVPSRQPDYTKDQQCSGDYAGGLQACGRYVCWFDKETVCAVLVRKWVARGYDPATNQVKWIERTDDSLNARLLNLYVKDPSIYYKPGEQH